MLRLAFDFIITWRETRTRPNAYIKTVAINKRNNIIAVIPASSIHKELKTFDTLKVSPFAFAISRIPTTLIPILENKMK